MTLRATVQSGLFLWLAGGAGCTTSLVSGPAPCVVDSAAGCGAQELGYSCRGSASPDQANRGLSCRGGTPGMAGTQAVTLYCCTSAPSASNTCAQVSVYGCPAPSLGFSCTNGYRPDEADSLLVCGQGTSGSAGSTVYCCDTTHQAAGSCAPDSAVSCTAAGGAGYTCPSGVALPSSLACGAGVAEGGGAMGYCCTPATTTQSCAPDSAVSCTAAGGAGYTCPSGVTPPSSLTCGAGVTESGGAMGYCCTAGTTVSSTCGPNNALTCGTGATGYSCTGADAPWQAMPSLICEPTSAPAGAGYCCVVSANTCAQAPTLVNCPAGSQGVACMGADTAMGANSALFCANENGGTANQFCCTTN